MKPHVLLLAALCCGLVSAAACDDTRAGYEARNRPAYAPDRDYAWNERESFRAEMERAIDRLETRLADLRAEAEREGAKVKAGTLELIEDAKDGLAELRQDLSEVGSSAREGWNDLQAELKEAMNDLGRRIEDAFD